MPTLASEPTAKIRGIGILPVKELIEPIENSQHRQHRQPSQHRQDASATLLSVSELLQQHLPPFARQYLPWLPPQVLNVLARLSLCRSRSLGRHCFQCPDCEGKSQVCNSCGERHCPQCGGARRKDWLEKTALLMLPGVAYFQVVLTVPDSLSPLILANRTTLYGLIMRSAWTTLREYLVAQGIQPAFLPTWFSRVTARGRVSGRQRNSTGGVVGGDWSASSRLEIWLLLAPQIRTLDSPLVSSSLRICGEQGVGVA